MSGMRTGGRLRIWGLGALQLHTAEREENMIRDESFWFAPAAGAGAHTGREAALR